MHTPGLSQTNSERWNMDFAEAIYILISLTIDLYILFWFEIKCLPTPNTSSCKASRASVCISRPPCPPCSWRRPRPRLRGRTGGSWRRRRRRSCWGCAPAVIWGMDISMQLQAAVLKVIKQHQREQNNAPSSLFILTNNSPRGLH